MTEIEALPDDEVRAGFEAAVLLINRMADASDSETRVAIVRMLQSQDPHEPLPDILTMMNRVLDERDVLRDRVARASERLQRAGGGTTLAILQGKQ